MTEEFCKTRVCALQKSHLFGCEPLVRRCLIGMLGLMSASFATSPAVALSITQPNAATVIAAGDDYATQVLGNAWDMSDVADIDTELEETPGVAGASVSAGIFSGSTSSNGAYFYPLFMGYPGSVNSSRGANLPIDTTHYRYATIKIRATQPAGTTQFTRFTFLKNGDSYHDGTFGNSGYATLAANQWMIIKVDLITNYDATHHQWAEFPVTGLRVEPATTNAPGTYAPVQFDIDWIRLTAPAIPAQLYPVQWTDSGYTGTYNITMVDTGGISTSLASGVGGTSYSADTTFLPPGQYTLKIARSDNSLSTISAAFRINNPPQIVMTAPSARGEQTQNFAQTVAGNPWGPIAAADFSLVSNFISSSISYANPTGSFYGRPANNDPGWFFNLGGHLIDTNLYRSLCFTMKDFGPRSIGIGSVARVFWGNGTSGTSLTTSQAMPLYTGLNEYCFVDLAAIPVEASPNGGAWSGTKSVLRLDPFEFPVSTACTGAPNPSNCHDLQLNSMVLSPFAQANPGYTFAWNLADTDNTSATLNFYLDPDNTPGNGNEIAIGNVAATNGAGQRVWPGSSAIQYGTYHILVVADDGINTVSQYAGGVIVVGARDGIFRNGFEN